MPTGKCLGFIIFEEGIEADPKKIQQIQQMIPQEVWKMCNGCQDVWHTLVDS